MRRLVFSLSLLLVACANPYSQFYRGIPDARVRPGYIATTEELKIYSTSDFERDRKALMQKGYMPVGDSFFNAGADTVTEAQLREQASKIGAHAVLVSSKFTHAVTDAIPLTLPNITTSYSSGIATAYGSGGSVTAYGSGTTTTYGTQTTYIPYTVNRSDFNAIYFVKVKPRIGFIAEPLNDEAKRMLQSNSGVRIAIVVEGSPAFEANVLPGDVLVSFGGETVRSIEHYQELLKALSGEAVEVVLNRDGRSLKLTLQVGKR